MSEVNHVLVLSYNGLPFLQKCIESLRAQDVPTQIMVVDNGSTDGTLHWMAQREQLPIWFIGNEKNLGVSVGWNQGLNHLFNDTGAQHVFVSNQDCVYPSYCVRELLAYDVPFVTGFPVDNQVEISSLTDTETARTIRVRGGLEPHPCFSAFLIRRECWETVGPFESSMFGWASDCAYHARAHRLGVPLWKSKVPFLHWPGSTTRCAPPDEQRWFIERANLDRAEFFKLYGCLPGTDEYSKLFAPEVFGVDAR